MHTAAELKERFPDMHVYDFHEDIRTYGRRHEDYYDKVSRAGRAFIRFDPCGHPRSSGTPW